MRYFKIEDEILDKIAVFVQNFIRRRPRYYYDVRNVIMDTFKLKNPNLAGWVMSALKLRRNILIFGTSSKFKVVYMPDDRAEAIKLYGNYLKTIPPAKIRVAKQKHAVILNAIKFLHVNEGMTVKDIAHELGYQPSIVRKYIGEIYAERVEKRIR